VTADEEDPLTMLSPPPAITVDGEDDEDDVDVDLALSQTPQRLRWRSIRGRRSSSMRGGRKKPTPIRCHSDGDRITSAIAEDGDEASPSRECCIIVTHCRILCTPG
jgi:hypothetical protein